MSHLPTATITIRAGATIRDVGTREAKTLDTQRDLPHAIQANNGQWFVMHERRQYVVEPDDVVQIKRTARWL